MDKKNIVNTLVNLRNVFRRYKNLYNNKKIKKYNGKQLTSDIQKEIQKIIKNQRYNYLYNEKKARKMANNWNGVISKPGNLRFFESAIPVVLCANESFAPYTAVMLQSLLDNTNLKNMGGV